MTNEQRKDRINALLEERRSYAKHNNENGMAQIDEELRKLGAEATPKIERAEKRPAQKKRSKETR